MNVLKTITIYSKSIIVATVVTFIVAIILFGIFKPTDPKDDSVARRVVGFVALAAGWGTFMICKDILSPQLPPAQPRFNSVEEYSKWYHQYYHNESAISEKPGDESEIETEEEIMPVEILDHRAMPHILMYGRAGLGKSALAKVTKYEVEKKYGHEIEFIEVTPGQLGKKKELDEIMLRVSRSPYCILFIDEVHGMTLTIEECMYKALQDGQYDITLNKDIDLGNGNSIVINEEKGVQTIQLPQFTCIGCTADITFYTSGLWVKQAAHTFIGFL